MPTEITSYHDYYLVRKYRCRYLGIDAVGRYVFHGWCYGCDDYHSGKKRYARFWESTLASNDRFKFSGFSDSSDVDPHDEYVMKYQYNYQRDFNPNPFGLMSR